jgi:hypothetical protein
VTQPNTHESFSRGDDVAMGSERSFGLVMAVVLGVIALINWWHTGRGSAALRRCFSPRRCSTRGGAPAAQYRLVQVWPPAAPHRQSHHDGAIILPDDPASRPDFAPKQGRRMNFLAEFWRFMRVRKKFFANAGQARSSHRLPL